MEDVEKRFNNILSISEECIDENELYNLLLDKSDKKIKIYDGFEPSGKLNIANCLMKVYNTNKLIKNGCFVIFWIADLYAQLNKKYNGDMDKIKLVGKYMISVWKEAGLDLNNVKFLWASEEIEKNSKLYWSLVMDIARKNNINRILRCTQAMGRKETDTLTLGQLLYPAMQCADIFLLKADICQMGTDQRKVNMLAREYANEIDKHHLAQRPSPIILSNHMLMGLKEDQEKMSKSDANSCIYIDDSDEEIDKKIKTAYCPPATSINAISKNPILNYLKCVIFPIKLEKEEKIIVENRDKEIRKYDNYELLEKDYISRIIAPIDIKNCLKKYLKELIGPIRKSLEKKEIKGMLEEIRNFEKK